MGSAIRSESGGRKSPLCVVPLQTKFDLTPLLHNAQVLLVPKAECKNCSEDMPSDILDLNDAITWNVTHLDSEPDTTEVRLWNMSNCLKKYIIVLLCQLKRGTHIRIL